MYVFQKYLVLPLVSPDLVPHLRMTLKGHERAEPCGKPRLLSPSPAGVPHRSPQGAGEH